MRQMLIYPGEDGYFVAEVPSLPGCISQGKTRSEAMQNIKEAIDLYIDVLREQGKSSFGQATPHRPLALERYSMAGMFCPVLACP